MLGTITVYHPGKKFPAFSVTGGSCELQCDHCRGRYLQGMRPVASPEDLWSKATALAAAGGEGFLLSGGCDRRGRIPLIPYLEVLGRIKQGTSLSVNVHTGLLSEDQAERLAGTGADGLSVDVLQDPRTIREVLHLEASPQDYASTLERLAPTGRLVPHVCVGLQSEVGEERTLELIASQPIAALVVLGLVPARGTPWEGRTVPPERLVRFIGEAVERVHAPVMLGCMRPRGDWSTEVKAVQAGISGLVNPSPRTLEWAAENGLSIETRERCCAVHR